MLTEKEEDGIKAILKMMTIDDLLSLTFTTTKGFVKPENQYEAIQAVLLYCEKASLLLRRRKIKRELLFQYLKDVGIVISVNGEKREFIAACLKYWEGKDSAIEDVTFEDLPDEEPVNVGNTDNSYLVVHNFSGQNLLSRNSHLNPAERTSYNQLPSQQCQFNSIEIEATALPSTEEIIQMGKLFVEWFYKILNENLQQYPSQSFGVSHFWPDCYLNWRVQGNDGPSKVNSVMGVENILLFLNTVIRDNRLYMNPAVEYIQTNYNSHGVVQVAVNGVLHQAAISVGLFEQVFFLIKDPLTDVWKIKWLNLQMKLNCTLASFLQGQTHLSLMFN